MDLAYVKGEWSFYNVYLKTFGGFLFYFLMGMMILALHSQMRSGFGEIFLWLMIFSFAGCHGFMLYKIAPRIELDTETITYNSKKFYWSELETFSFNGKYRVFFADRKEGMMLKFKEQKELYIFDDVFKNISDIKQFIKENVVEQSPTMSQPVEIAVEGQMEKYPDLLPLIIHKKITPNKINTVKTDGFDLTEEIFKTYNNFQFFNFRGYCIWLLPIGIFFGALLNFNIIGIISFIIFAFLWISLLSQTIYYFKLSNRSLVVRNNNLFWVKIIYSLEDIKELVFEQKDSKSPYTLRITTHNFGSDTYQAGTLWTITWFKLKNDVESKGIKVRNDCVINIWRP